MSNKQYNNTEEYRKAKRRLQKYFESEVPMYILSDLETLDTIQYTKDNKGLGLCAIPQAMFLFAVVNLFGYLMKQSEKQQENENFKYIFGIEANLFPEEYSRSWEALLKLYRNGLMHQVFPKACGISKRKPKGPLLEKNAEGEIVNLNVNVFTRDLKNAIEMIKNRITSEEHAQLAIRMSAKLGIIAKYDFLQRSKFTDNRLQECPRSSLDGNKGE